MRYDCRVKSIGFTLIELMVAIAILAVIASVALPSYVANIERTRRSDALSALTQAAALQERQFFSTNSYSNDIGLLMTGVTAATLTTPDGFYTLAAASTDATCGGAGTAGTCFVLTATAAGTQADDTDCNVFTLTSAGVQSVVDDANADSTAECWP